MNLAHFWGGWLIISGTAFAAITCIVTVKGFADLKNMFRELRKQLHH